MFNPGKLRLAFIIFSVLWVHETVNGQGTVSAYTDIGAYSHTFGSAFVAPVVQGAYSFRKYQAAAGFQWSYASDPVHDGFSGLYLRFQRSFYPGEGTWPLAIKAFYNFNPHSDLFRESNAGVLADYCVNHFRWQFGAHTRIWSMTPKARQQLDIPSGRDSRTVEPLNFLWSMQWSLKPVLHHWNIYGLISNFDNFVLLQETNPMIAAGYRYDFPSRLTLFAELGYRSAGLFNVQVQAYGFHVRTGIGWLIECREKENK